MQQFQIWNINENNMIESLIFDAMYAQQLPMLKAVDFSGLLLWVNLTVR